VLSEAASGRELTRWKTPKDWVLGMAFTPDGKTLVACTEDAKVRLWDIAEGEERQILEAGWIGRAVALSPDGRTVAMGTSQSTLRVWDIATGRSLLPAAEAHDAAVHAVAFSPDGKLLVSGGENRQVRIWDAATGRHLRRLAASARSLSFSPDGRRLASAWIWDPTARVWDVATGKELLKLPHNGAGEVAGVAFTAGGGFASVSWKRDGDRSPGSARLQSWDASGRPLREIELPKSRPQCLAVSPDGRWAAVGGLPHPAWLCDLQRGKILTSLHGQEKVVTAAAFSADGRTMITGSTDRAVRLWETATGKEIRTLGRHDRPVTAVAFAADGRRVASGEGDRNPDGTFGPPTVRVWDAATGRELQTLRGHESDVLGLAFSPDGRRLAAGLKDSTVLIWDVKTQLPSLTAAAPEEIDGLWSDLENADAGRADRAAWALATAPEKAVPLLERRLKPAASPDPKLVKQRLEELDSDDFATRDAAAAALAWWGGAVEAELRAALDHKPSAEVRRRIEALLAALDAPPSGEVLRSLRAVRVLERVGTPRARRVLEALAGGESTHRVTAEAKAALGRLGAPPAR
jgi:WD40 repeat protein